MGLAARVSRARYAATRIAVLLALRPTVGSVMARSVLHLRRDSVPRSRAPEAGHQVQAQIERGRHAARRDDEPFVDDALVGNDLATERSQLVERTPVRRGAAL